MTNRVYEGVRTPEGCQVTVDGQPLNPRFDLRNHSPDGFNWSYGGSGPAQLALALLADALGDDDLAQDHYQKFKWQRIGAIKADTFRITQDEIRSWLHELLNGKE